jgi:hypothetical protein
LENPPRVRLIAFGAGLVGIENALTRLRNQAKVFPLIDEVRTYTDKDLTLEYHQMFKDFPQQYPIGYGLWSWKPWLVSRELDSMTEGDILLYVDAGVELNPKGLDRFSYYLDLASRAGFVFFSLNLQNRFWTKHDTGLITLENYFRNQVAATAFFIQASDKSREFAKEWLQLCSWDSGRHLLDPNSDSGEHSESQHRHDQSILSSVVFKNEISVLDRDETYHHPWRKGRDYPLLALRNKTGTSLVSTHLSPLPFGEFRSLIKLMGDKTFRARLLKRLLSPKS